MAARECSVLNRAGHVVGAPNQIITILAVVRRSDAVETSLDTELASSREKVPVENLSKTVTIGIGSSIRIDDTAERVTLKIRTMRIQLTALITWVQ